MPGSLIGLTYSEFDNKVGPQLKFSYPTDVMSNELFEAFSDYVIVANQLCDKAIVVTLDDMLFLNCSVAIDNPKYDRNALLFSFGCILAEGADTEPYEMILRKISSTFVNLEIETEYLFQTESKTRVQHFLKTLYNDLTNHNESCIKLDNSNYFAVKLFQAPSQHIIIRDYDVPVFKLPCHQNNNLSQVITVNQPHQQYTQVDLSSLPWDISYQHLLPYIDGKSNVKRIIKQVDMDGDYVKRSLSLLLFHECIILTDIFKFTNVYQLIHSELSLQQLANPHVLNELREFCALDSRFCSTTADYRGVGKEGIPTNNQLINFVFKMQNNKTIQQIILDSLEPTVSSGSGGGGSLSNSRSAPALSTIAAYKTKTDLSVDHSNDESNESPRTLPFQNMDIARCVAYLQYLGIIKRVHEYPVYISPLTQESTTPTTQVTDVSNHAGPNRRRLSFGGVSSDISQPTRRLQLPESFATPDIESEVSAATTRENSTSAFKSKSQSMINLDFHAVGSGSGTMLKRRVSDVGQTDNNNTDVTIGLGISPAEPSLLSSNAGHQVEGVAGAGTLTPSDSSGNFQKTLSRTKVVVGRNYLTDTVSSVNTGDGHCATTSAKVSVESIAMSLVGKHHLDHICSEYNVSYSDIVQFPGISLVFK